MTKAFKIDFKKYFFKLAPYLIFAYLGNKLAWLYRLSPGEQMLQKLMFAIGNIQYMFLSWLPSFYITDFLFGILFAAAIRLALYLKSKNAKKYRPGSEYGSARWGNAKDIEPFIHPDFFQNIPLTQTERLTMESRPKIPKYARNKNIVVIGGSGSGKTRFFIKPSLMAMHSSYVVTDPKGTLIIECGQMLISGGYAVKCLNTINFAKSMHYNPFAYIRSERDILKLVNTIIMNTKGEGEKSGEDFWVSATRSRTVKSLRTSNGFPLFGELVV